VRRKERLQKAGIEILWEKGNDEEFLVRDGGGNIWFLNFFEDNEWRISVDKFRIKNPSGLDPEKFGHEKSYFIGKGPDDLQWEEDFWADLGFYYEQEDEN